MTDPAGNWKKFTNDALGNLVTVTEPDPANPATATLTTSYTYDYMKHLNTSTMTRGSTTQTRTFVYNDAGLLTSATNPENGAVTYTYGLNNTLQQKLDADGNITSYGYDSNNRVTQEQHLYLNTYLGYYLESIGQRITYTYDSNPINPYFSQYAAGRLTTVQYGDPSAPPGSGFIFGSYTEMYSYHPAGGVTVKEVQVVRPSENDIKAGVPEIGGFVLDVDYTYDSAGRRNSVTYPQVATQVINYYSVSLPSPVTYTTTYDSMGRPLALSDSTGMGWASGTQYDLAGRMTSVQYPGFYNPTVTETMSYNVNGQLASRNWTTGFTTTGLTYSYSATQNNGQITQMTDTLSGETVAYQYDALKRLTSAASTPNAGSTTAAWTQTYQYDGFGNLTAKVLNGTTTPIGVDSTTNRLSGTTAYDANGNLISGGSNWYDGRNRFSGQSWPSNYLISYDSSNHRIFQSGGGNPADPGRLTLYGAYGERLATYGFVGPFDTGPTGIVYSLSLVSANAWFNGRNIAGDSTFYQDRVGTDRSGGARYRPYGEEITSTSNDRVKFGTYIRDSATGMDYADQRYYASSDGRFNTPDPYGKSAKLRDPGSWNRYAYTRGDPVNRNDARGLDDDWFDYEGDQPGGGGDDGDPGDLIASVTVYGTADPVPCDPPSATNCSTSVPTSAQQIISGVASGTGGFGSLLGWGTLGSATAGIGGAWLAGGYIGSTALTTLGVAGGLAVETPFGQELQSLSSGALEAAQAVESGATLFRAGNMATSNLTNPQYWSLQNPLTTPGYALINGMPGTTSAFNYIQTGVLQPGGSFITNFASGIGTNTGGALQVVTGAGAVETCSFIICQ